MYNKTETPKKCNRPRRGDIAFLLNPEERPLKRVKVLTLPESALQPSATSPLDNESQPLSTTSDNGNGARIRQLPQTHVGATVCSQSRPLIQTTSDTHDMHVEDIQRVPQQQQRTTVPNRRTGNPPKNSQALPNNLPCDECGICFYNEQAVKRHKRKQHPSGDQKSASVQCPECKLILKSPHNLTRHVRTHGPGAKFECSECHARFVTKASRSIHMREIHGRQPKQQRSAEVSFLCPQGCGYASSQRSNVSRHNENVHLGMRTFMCPCGHRASTKANLQAHMDTHRRNGKNYERKRERCI